MSVPTSPNGPVHRLITRAAALASIMALPLITRAAALASIMALRLGKAVTILAKPGANMCTDGPCGEVGSAQADSPP